MFGVLDRQCEERAHIVGVAVVEVALAVSRVVVGFRVSW